MPTLFAQEKVVRSGNAMRVVAIRQDYLTLLDLLQLRSVQCHIGVPLIQLSLQSLFLALYHELLHIDGLVHEHHCFYQIATTLARDHFSLRCEEIPKHHEAGAERPPVLLLLKYGYSLGQVEHRVIQSLLAGVLELICDRLCGEEDLGPHVKLVKQRVQLVVLQLVVSEQVDLQVPVHFVFLFW